MKSIQNNVNLYAVILFMTILASVWQMNLLGKGIFTQTKNINIAEEQAPANPTVPAAVSTPTEKGFVPTRIEMKSVGINLPVVSVPLKNGTWEVYPHVANFAQGTSIVNSKTGNVGIYGHDRADAFTKIKQLLTGSDIMLINDNYRATYKVITSKIINPTDVSVFYPTNDPELTLTTCDGTFSQKRYMVRAKLIKIEKLK